MKSSAHQPSRSAPSEKNSGRSQKQREAKIAEAPAVVCGSGCMCIKCIRKGHGAGCICKRCSPDCADGCMCNECRRKEQIRASFAQPAESKQASPSILHSTSPARSQLVPVAAAQPYPVAEVKAPSPSREPVSHQLIVRTEPAVVPAAAVPAQWQPPSARGVTGDLSAFLAHSAQQTNTYLAHAQNQSSSFIQYLASRER